MMARAGPKLDRLWLCERSERVAQSLLFQVVCRLRRGVRCRRGKICRGTEASSRERWCAAWTGRNSVIWMKFDDGGVCRTEIDAKSALFCLGKRVVKYKSVQFGGPVWVSRVSGCINGRATLRIMGECIGFWSFQNLKVAHIEHIFRQRRLFSMN